jgi:hypothetical protein
MAGRAEQGGSRGLEHESPITKRMMVATQAQVQYEADPALWWLRGLVGGWIEEMGELKQATRMRKWNLNREGGNSKGGWQ